MCGFVGYIDNTKNKDKTIKKMNDKIKHRGPDSQGYYIDDYIALGFRRLSIIDLKNGDQPMYNIDKSIVIVFNGEIYNYKEIKKDLIKKKYKFKTNSDTEVLLNAYIEYKEKVLNKLRGMFSFVIYDKNKKEIFAARDFFGIKPFYYYKDEDVFMFGSEIKSFIENPNFKKDLNLEALKNYLTFQYSPGEDTFFNNVKKLLPGHYLKYKNNKIEIKQYYDLKLKKENKSKEYYLKNLEKALDSSIKAHKVSDVEVGSFLSSGVDSSFIATKSKINKTFTVGFENKNYSEIDYAKDLSKKIKVENISKIISKEEFFKEFSKIQYHMDEPIADPAAVALYFVSNIASKHLKVSLSGEGADEIFGGYKTYQEPFFFPSYYKIPFLIRKYIGKLAGLLPEKRGLNILVRRSKRLEDRYVGNAFIFSEKEIKNILKYKSNTKFQDLTKNYYKDLEDFDDVSKMQYIDLNFWLVGDILLKADKMSMANSLEVRVPFLDKEVFEIGKKIPTKYKVDNKETKKIFREISSKVLEDKVSKKEKLGFPVPIRLWLKEEDIYLKVKKEFENNKFFNEKEIIKLLDDHKLSKKDNSRKIWTLYTFLIWYKEFF